MTPVTGQAHRASRQWQASAELRILEGHPELPCIAWTVGPASSVLAGQVSGPASASRARQALGPGECREQPGGGGVTVRLTVTVFEQEEA